MKRFAILTVCLGLLAVAGRAQNPAPAGKQEGPVLILHATAHLGNGTVIPDALVAFDHGKLTRVEALRGTADTTGYALVIHADGKHLYPGLINCNSTVGLTEIDAVRSTRDYDETGDLNPNVRSAISYNTDSKIIPTLRVNGILLAEAAPQGGRISGTSSVMQLDAWNWEDALYAEDVAIHLHWPNMHVTANNEKEGVEKQREKISQEIGRLEAYFREAKAYAATKAPEEKNLRFESMKGLFDGSKVLMVHAYYVKAIESAAAFCRRLGVKMVLVGGTDAWMVTGLLKKQHIPVVLVKTHQVPPREDSDVDLPYKLPYLLHRDSVEVAISFDGSWNSRNLHFDAGTAVTYGLTKEEALMCITSVPARILGIADRTGSLEAGKDANLILSSGDILDMQTNHIEEAFIQGRRLVLDDVQQQLYRKYKKKYGL